LLSSEQKY